MSTRYVKCVFCGALGHHWTIRCVVCGRNPKGTALVHVPGLGKGECVLWYGPKSQQMLVEALWNFMQGWETVARQCGRGDIELRVPYAQRRDFLLTYVDISYLQACAIALHVSECRHGAWT